MEQVKRRATEMRSKAVGGGIFGFFPNVDNFRPEAVSDVITSVVVDLTGMKALVEFGDSSSNRSQDI